MGILLGLALLPIAAKEAQYELRTWTSVQGSTLKGHFDSADGDTITLIREDGSKLKVPFSKLIAADQQYARHLIVQTQPFVVAFWGNPNAQRGFGDLANLVPIRVEWIAVNANRLTLKLPSYFSKWNDKPCFRHVIMNCTTIDVASKKQRRNLKEGTKRLLKQARDSKITPLILDDEGIQSPYSIRLQNDKGETEEFQVSPELFHREQQKWIDEFKESEEVKVIPYRQLLEALRNEDPRWIEVLGSGFPPSYLKDAVVIATLTGQEPPLLALRAAQREKMQDFQKKQERFKNLACLPEDQAALVSKLIHELVNDVNKK